MTALEPQPGDVATFAGERIVFTYDDLWLWATTGLAVRDQHSATVTARPLVVIDPEDEVQVERLVRAFWDAQRPDDGESSDVTYMAAALREFANPTPPKPEVYEHLAVTHAPSTTAICGKVWTPNRDGVTVVGKCPECAEVAAEGWVA